MTVFTVLLFPTSSSTLMASAEAGAAEADPHPHSNGIAEATEAPYTHEDCY